MAFALLLAALVLILLGVFVLKALLIFGIVAAVVGAALWVVGYRSATFTRTRTRRRF